MSDDDYESENSPHNTLTTAYDLAKQIKQDIERIDLEEAYTAVTVDLEVEDNNTEVNYLIEATDVYTETDYTPETNLFQNSDRIEPLDGIEPADEEMLIETLEENLESALKVNGRVVKELLSPDYDAF